MTKTMTPSKSTVACLATVAAIAVLTSGCATHKFVRTQDVATRAELGQEIEGVSGQVEAMQSDVARLETGLEQQGEQLEGLSATAQEALDRALAAGKLAEGKFLYETVLADDKVKFGFDEATLTDDAKAELDRFAEQLGTRNEDVFIEIQGHTDATGPETHNLTLGEKRAEAVRRYLSMEHSFPLHRMAVISYGEASPLADNSSREGRAQNRRVALVVLQ